MGKIANFRLLLVNRKEDTNNQDRERSKPPKEKSSRFGLAPV